MYIFSTVRLSKLFTITIILMFTLCTPNISNAKVSYEAARDSYYSLIKSNKKKNFRHNWENTINRFLAVTKSKNDPKAPDATFMAGELYRMMYKYSSVKDDLFKSIEYYEKVAKKFKNDSLADDSVFKVGEIYEKKLNDYNNAYLAYQRVTKEFPQGDMASKAKSKLIRLKKYAPKKKETIKKPELPPLPLDLTAVTDIKYWSGKENTSIVIYPEKSIDFKYNYLGRNVKKKIPPRLYIDLFNTKLNQKISPLVEVKDGLLRAIRSEQHAEDVVRIVLDIQDIDNYRVFTFEDPFRIVLDVSGESLEDISLAEMIKENKGKSVKTIPVPETKKAVSESSEKINYTLAKQLGLGVKKIVIDPGHGGRDPGAVGIGKLKESDVTLKISKKLKNIIEENLDCEVILTRDNDKTVSLEERTAIAKNNKADLFISVHTNASEKNNARGIETYFLNYATDDHAMKTAARENATSKLALSDLESIVKIINYSNVVESKELAEKVQSALYNGLSKSYKGVKDLGVKQAPFYVLFGSKKPSILIEASFIDHKVEGKRLKDDKYIAALADSIYNGINEYINGFDLAKSN